MHHDGMRRSSAKDIELADVRSGATPSRNNEVNLDPGGVALRKDWSSDMAKIVHDEFVRRLQRSNRHQIVTEARDTFAAGHESCAMLRTDVDEAHGSGRK